MMTFPSVHDPVYVNKIIIDFDKSYHPSYLVTNSPTSDRIQSGPKLRMETTNGYIVWDTIS